MRVLHVAPSFARRDGGPSEMLRGLVPALRALQCDVTLVTTDKGATREEIDGVRADGVRIAASLPPRRLNFSPELRSMVRAEISRADVVHVHSVNTYTSTVAMTVARRHGVPYVIESHGAWDAYHMAQRRLTKRVYNGVVDRRNFRSLAAAVYSSTKEAREGQNVCDARPAVVPLGVDPQLFEQARNPDSDPFVLFLGRVTQKKRLDLVLAALASLMSRGVRLQLVVAGPIDDRLTWDPKRRADELGIANQVTFRGTVGAVTRADLLARASAFVLPSDDESFGIAAAEALAAGCPVIASEEVGVIADAAAAGGALIVDRTVASVAAGLLALTERPDAVAAITVRGRSYARSSLQWEAVAEDLIRLYSSVAR